MSEIDRDIKLVCPKCKSDLMISEGTLHCKICKKKYGMRDGIPEFTDTYTYWGEIPQDEMNDINRRIKSEYWKKVLANYPSDVVQQKRYFIEDTNRANFHFYSNIDFNSSILDIGSGLGTISESVSRFYRKVVSIEPVLERIIFSSIRFKQEGISNITLIKTDLSNLPFQKESFDLIIMNGILEWVGLSDIERAPESVQLRVLKELCTLLKPGGVLYIGIENRFGISFFFGRLDHNYLRYTSLMPRFVANRITKKKKGHPYRTYTHSVKGYGNLLLMSGFKKFEVFSPVGGYNNPRYIVPLNSKELKLYFTLNMSSERKIRKSAKKAMATLRAYNWISPDFIIFARKRHSAQKNRFMRLIDKGLSRMLNQTVSREFSLMVQNTSKKHITFLVFIEQKSNPVLVVKYSLNEKQNSLIEKEYGNMEYVYKKMPEKMKDTIASPVSLNYIDGRAVSMRKFIQGTRLLENVKRENLAITCKEIGEWLLEFHRAFSGANLCSSTEDIHDMFHTPLRAFLRRSNTGSNPKFDAWLKERIEALLRVGIPGCPQHGDFWHENMVVTKERLGIYDWEFFNMIEVPGFDLFHFLTMLLISPDIMGGARLENFSIFFSENKISNAFRETAIWFFDKIGIGWEHGTILYFYYLLAFFNTIAKAYLGQEIIRDFEGFINIFIERCEHFIL